MHLMTDTIKIINKNNEIIDVNCSFQSKAIYIDGIDDRFEKWNTIERKVTERLTQTFYITDIKYQGTWYAGMEHTKILYSESLTSENKSWTINIQNFHQNGGSFVGINNWSLVIQDADIDEVIQLLQKYNNENSEMIINKLTEYKTTKDEFLIRQSLQDIANVSSIGQLIIWALAMLWR